MSAATLCRYDDAADYWRVREFLRAVFARNGRRQLSWPVLRWDYWRWHVNENIFHVPLDQAVALWQRDGAIVAALNIEGPEEAFLQVHPDARSDALESAMLDEAERRVAPGPDGERALRIWADSQDGARQALLAARGYRRGEGAEHQRWRALSQPIAPAPAPPGYTVRALGDDSELPARSWLSWRAFHPDEPDERYEGWEWYRNVQRIPLYRRDLDLVAVAEDGELAGFATVWLDDVTRTAIFEPVGTHPGHQRRGVGRALMDEGLRRAAHMGADLAMVGSYSPAAHALYQAAGFHDFTLSEPWDRRWR